MGCTNFLVTNAAASLPKTVIRNRGHESTVLSTHCRRLIQLGGPKSNHDGIHIIIYDLRVMRMAISDTVLRLNFLDGPKWGI
jgi:hypothetical protein